MRLRAVLTSSVLMPASCVFSRDGAYVYGGSGSAATIAGFSVNPGTSVLTALTGSPFDSGGALPVALATDDVGRLFVAHFGLDQLRVFATSDGVLSPVTGNPFAKGMLGLANTPYGLLHPDGYYLVADRTGNRVGVYHIEGSGDATTLTAVAGSPFTAGGTYTNTLALNRRGTLLFAANGASHNITSYGFDASTGALTGERIQPWGTAGSTGIITGMAYVPGFNYLFLPLIQR